MNVNSLKREINAIDHSLDLPVFCFLELKEAVARDVEALTSLNTEHLLQDERLELAFIAADAFPIKFVEHIENFRLLDEQFKSIALYLLKKHPIAVLTNGDRFSSLISEEGSEFSTLWTQIESRYCKLYEYELSLFYRLRNKKRVNRENTLTEQQIKEAEPASTFYPGIEDNSVDEFINYLKEFYFFRKDLTSFPLTDHTEFYFLISQIDLKSRENCFKMIQALSNYPILSAEKFVDFIIHQSEMGDLSGQIVLSNRYLHSMFTLKGVKTLAEKITSFSFPISYVDGYEELASQVQNFLLSRDSRAKRAFVVKAPGFQSHMSLLVIEKTEDKAVVFIDDSVGIEEKPNQYLEKMLIYLNRLSRSFSQVYVFGLKRQTDETSCALFALSDLVSIATEVDFFEKLKALTNSPSIISGLGVNLVSNLPALIPPTQSIRKIKEFIKNSGDPLIKGWSGDFFTFKEQKLSTILNTYSAPQFNHKPRNDYIRRLYLFSIACLANSVE